MGNVRVRHDVVMASPPVEIFDQARLRDPALAIPPSRHRIVTQAALPKASDSCLTCVLRWLIGLATSLIGNHIYLVTLAWAAVQTTTPANVGLILVAGSIPQAALLLIGGVFVDRGSDRSRPSSRRMCCAL